MTPVLMHIGPITRPDGQPGDSLFFLHPANTDQPPVLAATLALAIPLLGELGELSCEPALASQALALNLPVQPLTEAARHSLAMMAIGLATSDFASVEREGLVFQFCRAFAAFMARKPQDWPVVARILQVTVSGAASLSALIVGAPALVLAPTPEEAQVEGIAATASHAAAEILDALSRAHGLSCLPSAFRLHEGAKLRVTDIDLAVLTATLYAIATVEPVPGAVASGEVSVEGCIASVTVRVT